MSTHTEQQSSRERSWIYITAIVLLAIAAIVAVVAFRDIRETERAQAKADELIIAFAEAGAARTPDRDTVIRVFGDDGGAACDDPNGALRRATLFTMLANGASGPGARPIVADSRVVRGQLLVLEVYCPDELEEFREFVEDLKTDDVAWD